jgi:hypothetical protein
MASGVTLLFSGALCLGFASTLFGQIDSYQLRAKYRPPLDRETFTIAPGFQIIVDYGPDQQVRRLEVPPGVSSPKQADDVLLELVPMSMRGKELGSGLNFMSRASIKFTDYEHISIGEPQDPDVPGRRTGVTVVFKSSATALFGQIDSYHLRAKYGPPLARDAFTITSAFQIIVDYGPDQQACRLELPVDRKQADDVLLELVPVSMRGKQLNIGAFSSGPNSIKFTTYEHVMISESQTSVTVAFKREVCRNP